MDGSKLHDMTDRDEIEWLDWFLKCPVCFTCSIDEGLYYIPRIHPVWVIWDSLYGTLDNNKHGTWDSVYWVVKNQ